MKYDKPQTHSRTYLKHRACPQDGSLHSTSIALLAESSQAVDKEVGALRLTRTTLTGDDNALVDPFVQHCVEGSIRNGKDVRFELAQRVVLIHLDISGIVDGEKLEGVDRDKNVACKRVDLLLVEAMPQGSQNALLRQLGEVT